MSMLRPIRTALLIGAVGLGLSGCVAYDPYYGDPYYGYGGGYGGGYYQPYPYAYGPGPTVDLNLGFGSGREWHDGGRGWRDGRGWRR